MTHNAKKRPSKAWEHNQEHKKKKMARTKKRSRKKRRKNAKKPMVHKPVVNK